MGTLRSRVDYRAEIIAISLTFIVHVVGAVALVWAMLDDRGWSALRDWWPRDDPPPPDDGPRDDGDGPGGLAVDLPLPTASASPVRLREPGRIGDTRPRPARRPEHEPLREPVRR